MFVCLLLQAGLVLVGSLWCIGSLMQIFKVALQFSFHEHMKQPELLEDDNNGLAHEDHFGSSTLGDNKGACFDVDNLGERDFQELCGFRPIDVVYTWVNGGQFFFVFVVCSWF